MLNNKFFCYYSKTHYEINNLLKINLVCLLLCINNFYVIFDVITKSIILDDFFRKLLNNKFYLYIFDC